MHAAAGYATDQQLCRSDDVMATRHLRHCETLQGKVSSQQVQQENVTVILWLKSYWRPVQEKLSKSVRVCLELFKTELVDIFSRRQAGTSATRKFASQARKTCTTRDTYRRQMGHSANRLPHSVQDTMCPHSNSRQSTTASIQTLHRLSSDVFSLASATIKTRRNLCNCMDYSFTEATLPTPSSVVFAGNTRYYVWPQKFIITRLNLGWRRDLGQVSDLRAVVATFHWSCLLSTAVILLLLSNWFCWK